MRTRFNSTDALFYCALLVVLIGSALFVFQKAQHSCDDPRSDACAVGCP